MVSLIMNEKLVKTQLILVAYWLCDSRIEAINKEGRLKCLSPDKKLLEATQRADYFNS